MKRVLILGRGGSGKSTLARRLGALTGLPAIELDKIFWQPDLVPLPPDHWAAVQEKLIAEERWILDGDLGPYDVVEPRFSAADTIIVLDFSLVRCVWQAFQRSRERAGFWQWVWMYRRRYRPILMQAIAKNAQNAQLLILPSPKAVRRLLANIARAAV